MFTEVTGGVNVGRAHPDVRTLPYGVAGRVECFSPIRTVQAGVPPSPAMETGNAIISSEIFMGSKDSLIGRGLGRTERAGLLHFVLLARVGVFGNIMGWGVEIPSSTGASCLGMFSLPAIGTNVYIIEGGVVSAPSFSGASSPRGTGSGGPREVNPLAKIGVLRDVVRGGEVPLPVGAVTFSMFALPTIDTG